MREELGIGDDLLDLFLRPYDLNRHADLLHLLLVAVAPMAAPRRLLLPLGRWDGVAQRGLQQWRLAPSGTVEDCDFDRTEDIERRARTHLKG